MHYFFLLLSLLTLTGCSTLHDGCSTHHELPPLRLSSAQRRLLKSVQVPPKTALDYYMHLPSSSFSIMPDDPERRISYIQLEKLTDSFLQADSYFECDGGGFDLTIKICPSKPVMIAILQDADGVTHHTGTPYKGVSSICINRPIFWTFKNNQWVKLKQDKIFPPLTPEKLINKYVTNSDTSKTFSDQLQYIMLDCRPTPTSLDIIAEGRGNFDRYPPYPYALYKWDGNRFLLKYK